MSQLAVSENLIPDDPCGETGHTRMPLTTMEHPTWKALGKENAPSLPGALLESFLLVKRISHQVCRWAHFGVPGIAKRFRFVT